MSFSPLAAEAEQCEAHRRGPATVGVDLRVAAAGEPLGRAGDRIEDGAADLGRVCGRQEAVARLRNEYAFGDHHPPELVERLPAVREARRRRGHQGTKDRSPARGRRRRSPPGLARSPHAGRRPRR